MNAQVKPVPAEAPESGTAIAEFKPTEAALDKLRHDFGGLVLDVAKPEEMQIAVKARAELRGYRTSLEKVRADLKAPVLALGRKIDAEAARLTSEIQKLEEPIDQLIKAEESRRENERKAKEAAEVARIEGIQARIAKFQTVATSMVGASPATIAAKLTEVSSDDLAWAQEYRPTAMNGQLTAIQALEQLHAGAIALERQRAEDAARKAQQEAEFAKLRAEQEARDKAERERAIAEQTRILEENKKRAAEEAAHKAKLEDEEREARQRREAEETAHRRKLEEDERAARAQRQADEAKAKAEREAREKEERKAREAREAEERRIAADRAKVEAERREVERRAAELLDAQAMLDTFVAKFGHLDKFAGVVGAIKALAAKSEPVK